jgi:hypothetical protein
MNREQADKLRRVVKELKQYVADHPCEIVIPRCPAPPAIEECDAIIALRRAAEDADKIRLQVLKDRCRTEDGQE